MIYIIKKIEDNLLNAGYIENMNVIIETNKALRENINLVTKLFPSRVNMIFILNLSEIIYKKHWKMIESPKNLIIYFFKKVAYKINKKSLLFS